MTTTSYAAVLPVVLQAFSTQSTSTLRIRPFGTNEKNYPLNHGQSFIYLASEGWDQQEKNDNLKSARTTFGAEAVPEDQRPANEYLNLIQQPLFGWADEKSGNVGLAVRLLTTYLIFLFAVCFPIAGATYTGEGYMLQKFASANVGASFVIFFLLIRLYSGWGFVASRLQSKVIEYEETGWYDGNFEMKTESERARDLFLYRKDVKPVVERLKVATLAVGCFVVASCIALNVATSMKPVFDEYNPELLKSLSYDEKLAEIAARQSGGRPTYCDNRYYRAVANGGQGCN